ncbi:hypothetical protein FHS20_001500 [Phyllobacterium endophyticum]|nr:hypothetical protein [Phyllobacterium endophyticum]
MALFCDTVLMNPKVHCAPVLENHHFRLALTRISIYPTPVTAGG